MPSLVVSRKSWLGYEIPTTAQSGQPVSLDLDQCKKGMTDREDCHVWILDQRERDC